MGGIDIAPYDESAGRRQERHVKGLPVVAIRLTEIAVAAENHIGFTGALTAIVIERRADNEVIKPVAVDVAGRRHAASQLIVRAVARDDEAVIGGKAVNLDHLAAVRGGSAETVGFSVHNVGLAGVTMGVVAEHRADDNVGEAVAIDIAGAGNAPAQLIGWDVVAGDEEAGRLRQGLKLDDALSICGADHPKVAGAAEEDKGLAAVDLRVVAKSRADDEVVEPVAIDVAGGRYAVAGLI